MTRQNRKVAPSRPPEGEAGQGQKESQARRLAAMNEQLSRYGLAPLTQTGTHQKGEFELLEVVSVEANPWYVTVQFAVIRPDGKQGQFFLKFAVEGASRRSCVLVPMIGDSIVFVRQHRPATLVHPNGHWTTELPREFAIAGREPTIVDRKLRAARKVATSAAPISLTGRELAPLLTSDATHVEAFEFLGSFPEDTGMSTVVCDAWLLRMRVEDEDVLSRLRGTKAMGIRIHPLSEVVRDRQGFGITDAHSSAALFLLYEHLGLVRFP